MRAFILFLALCAGCLSNEQMRSAVTPEGVRDSGATFLDLARITDNSTRELVYREIASALGELATAMEEERGVEIEFLAQGLMRMVEPLLDDEDSSVAEAALAIRLALRLLLPSTVPPGADPTSPAATESTTGASP